MQIFNFNGATVRTVTLAGGEPGFVGKDVCDRLGYANASKAISDHCKGLTIRYPLQTAGGVQQVRVLTEADVMRLIVSSTLPEAVAFERWVFEDVLPSLRKTGAYAVPTATPAATPASVEAVMFAVALNQALNLTGSAALGTIQQAVALKAPDMLAIVPVYAVDSPSGSGAVSSEATDSLSALMKAHDIKGAAASMNARLALAGYLERKTREGKSGSKEFWSVTEAGQKYGKNLTSPQNPRETQPHWYRGRFRELMDAVNSK